VAFLAVSAAALSTGYIAYYLRGGPRIIDATSYWLEARALAHGYAAFPIPAPTGSFRGRFLLTAPHGQALSVIFPPGYPAALAAGFWTGFPLAVGPIIGSALVLATYMLTRAVDPRPEAGLVGALLSVLSSCLRYHCADTMSHGWAALLLTWGLVCALSLGRASSALAGLACGWLIATRPITGILGTVLCGSVCARRRGWAFLPALAPGLALLAWHQHAATGNWWGSTQLHYYALADGPPGCFRYGFGANVGCWFEHGDFVRAQLAHGFGLPEALRATIRRLALHLSDIDNLEVFALLLPVGVFARAGERGPRLLLGAAVVGLVAAYFPFYFDASYPGGGARLFADVLPIEHALVGSALVQLRLARFAGPAALVGFALHTSHGHDALAAREGGHPMFEPAVLARARLSRGLLFVGSDHGFNLGHEPGAADPRAGLVVARWDGDGHDRLLWERMGRPPSYRYLYDPRQTDTHAAVLPYVPPETAKIEAEEEWPPLRVTKGWAYPVFSANRCVSGGRGLRFAQKHGPTELAIELMAPAPARYDLTMSWVLPLGTVPSVWVDGQEKAVEHSVDEPVGTESCVRFWVSDLELTASSVELRVRLELPGLFDYAELTPRP
jgi:hypothetical protein